VCLELNRKPAIRRLLISSVCQSEPNPERTSKLSDTRSFHIRDNKLIANLLKDYKKPEDITGENGLLKQLTKQLLSASTKTSFHCTRAAYQRARSSSIWKRLTFRAPVT
jgi:hypothetical protein